MANSTTRLRVVIVFLALWLFAFVCQVAAQESNPTSVQQAPSTAPTDTSPKLRDFPKSLPRIFAGLWSRQNLTPLVFGAVAATATIPADSRVAGFFEDGSRLHNFDSVGKPLGQAHLLGTAIGASFLIGQTTNDLRFRQTTYSLMQGLVVTSALTHGIKMATGRERPDLSNRLSFPSGHTSNSFMWATILSHYYGPRAGVPAYAVASYVAASRLKSRKHYLTDIITGATLGYIVGKTVTRAAGQSHDPRLQFGVAVPPGGGAALTMRIRLD